MYLLRRIHISPAYLLIPISLSLLSAAFEGAGMGLLIPILNGFLQQNFAFAKETPYLSDIVNLLPDSVLNSDRMLFVVMLVGFIVIYTLKNVLRFLSVVTTSYFSERSLHHLRKTLFTQYLSFGKLFFDTTNIGHHSTLLMDFTKWALTPLSSIDKLINAMFSLVAYLVVMFVISWRLTLVALPLFVLLHYAVRFIMIRVKALSRAMAKRGSELGKKSIEILSTIPLVKSYRTEHREQKLYADISNEKAKIDFQVRTLQALLLPVQEIITLFVATGILMGALAFFGREQIASAPAIIVYFYIVLNASNKFGALSAFRSTLAACTGPLDEVLILFDDSSKYFVRGGDKKFAGLKHEIEFKNLSFGYADDRTVLKNLSFTFKKGKMTAIVGPTGAGKSTLISLLMRYYDCPEKSIFVDGTDIRELTLDSYLHHVALVSQETLLLHDSLRNNITYGLADVPDAKVYEVIERARLADYIAQLPDGLNTLIGDRGVKLSGGEKQRVSIARALLKGSDILILDEATSSLDSKTEQLIQGAIDDAIQGRTAIVIAHRLSTIKHADTIVVFENGGLIEEGTLDELLENKGTFSELWEQQKF